MKGILDHIGNTPLVPLRRSGRDLPVPVLVKRMAQENGWFLTDQFNNPANMRVHEATTAASPRST